MGAMCDGACPGHSTFEIGVFAMKTMFMMATITGSSRLRVVLLGGECRDVIDHGVHCGLERSVVAQRLGEQQ